MSFAQRKSPGQCFSLFCFLQKKALLISKLYKQRKLSLKLRSKTFLCMTFHILFSVPLYTSVICRNYITEPPPYGAHINDRGMHQMDVPLNDIATEVMSLPSPCSHQHTEMYEGSHTTYVVMHFRFY